MQGSEMTLAPVRYIAMTSRLGVRLGLFAMLFQAMLFAWHHHPLVLAFPPPRCQE